MQGDTDTVLPLESGHLSTYWDEEHAKEGHGRMAIADGGGASGHIYNPGLLFLQWELQEHHETATAKARGGHGTGHVTVDGAVATFMTRRRAWQRLKRGFSVDGLTFDSFSLLNTC